MILFVFLFCCFSIYTLVVYTTGTNVLSPEMNENAVKGKILYQKYNCTACHQLFGLGGYLGPELTTTISQPGKGPLYASALLSTGTLRMPDFHLSKEEINQIVEFLKYVDSTVTHYK